MTTTELDNLRQKVGVKQALQNLVLDQASGDTGLTVSNEITDGTKVQLTSMVDGLIRPPISMVHAERVLEETLDEAGTMPAFWIPGMAYQPPEPVVGTTKCMLHPDFDETNGPAGFGREFIDKAGLAGFFCNRGDVSKKSKDNFTSVFDRDQHMKHKHKTQWELIEAAINKDEERDEKTQRQLDREVLMALARSAGGQPEPQIKVEPPLNQQIYVEPEEPKPSARVPTACLVEDCEFVGKGPGGLSAHMRMKVRHGDGAHVVAQGVEG